MWLSDEMKSKHIYGYLKHILQRFGDFICGADAEFVGKIGMENRRVKNGHFFRWMQLTIECRCIVEINSHETGQDFIHLVLNWNQGKFFIVWFN